MIRCSCSKNLRSVDSLVTLPEPTNVPGTIVPSQIGRSSSLAKCDQTDSFVPSMLSTWSSYPYCKMHRQQPSMVFPRAGYRVAHSRVKVDALWMSKVAEHSYRTYFVSKPWQCYLKYCERAEQLSCCAWHKWLQFRIMYTLCHSRIHNSLTSESLAE